MLHTHNTHNTHNPILEKAGVTESANTQRLEGQPDPRLAAVEESLALSSKRIAESSERSESAIIKTETAGSVLAKSIQDINSANQTIKLQADTARLQTQNAANNLLDASGGTLNQVRLMTELRQDGNREAELLDQIDVITDQEHTGLFIIDSIINDFQSAPERAQLLETRAQQQQTVNRIATQSAAQESFARINAINEQVVTEATIEANQKKIAATSSFQAAEIEIKNVHTNAAAMNDLNRISQQEVANRLQLFRLEGEVAERKLKEERMVFQREQMQFAREKFEIEIPQARLNLEASILRLETARTTNPTDITAAIANNLAAVKRHEDAVAAELQITKQINVGQSLLGLTVEPRETTSFKLNNPATRDKYIRLQEIGGVDDPVIGNSPFEARTNLAIIDDEGLAKKTKGIKLLSDISVKQADKWAKNKAAGGIGIPKDPTQQKVEFNITADEVIEIVRSEIKTGDNSNPFSAPPFPLLAKKASVQNTALFQKVLKDKDMQETNPQIIMDAALAGIVAKTITPEEAAAGIEAIFDAAALHNNTLDGGFRRVGLPNQETYNVKLDRIPTLFETLKAVPELTSTLIFNFGKVTASEAGSLQEFREEQIGAFVSVDLMDSSDVQQAIVIVLSTLRDTAAPKKKGEE